MTKEAAVPSPGDTTLVFFLSSTHTQRGMTSTRKRMFVTVMLQLYINLTP